ncbi:MAG: PH domain-containing protein [Patescibacteria group bacterium]
MTLKEFIHQKSYEHIAFRIRAHVITTVPAIAIFLIFLGIPPLFYWLTTTQFYPGIQPQPTVALLLTLIAGAYYLSIGIFYYTYFVNYYLNLLIITNDRLLDVEQEGLFSRTISEVDLYKIQDITSTVDGFFQSMFNYGNLQIQTAGATEKFTITNVPRPESLRQKILDLAEEDRKFHSKTGNIMSATN